jgi:hypothetical protein
MSQEAVLQSLRKNAEGYKEIWDGVTFRQVYLDNAIPSGMSRHQFAGYLSALEKEGLYKKVDGFFGMVRDN